MEQPTNELIKKEALNLFVEKGYTGTSLANIGDKVGIKKQSIYTHFKSKDDLFLEVLDKAITIEKNNLQHFFNDIENLPLFEILYEFIIHIRERFIYENDNLRFLLRMMFIPPLHLQNTVILKMKHYYDTIENHIEKQFTDQQEHIKISVDQAKDAYLNIIDGLLVELNYVNVESFDKRLRAIWSVFCDGVKK